jgi:hypothetical protein
MPFDKHQQNQNLFVLGPQASPPARVQKNQFRITFDRFCPRPQFVLKRARITRISSNQRDLSSTLYVSNRRTL